MHWDKSRWRTGDRRLPKSCAAPPSVYERVMERLQHADDEMDEAIESLKACCREARLFRSFVRRHQQWQKRPRSAKRERRARRSEAKLTWFRVHREFAPWLAKPKRASGRDNSGPHGQLRKPHTVHCEIHTNTIFLR